MVAYPSFMDQVRKGRRSDAIDFASRIQQLQERHRANNPTYAANLAALGITSSSSPNGYYTLATSAGSGGAAANSYTVTATAVSGKSQASDSGCTQLTITVAPAGVTYGPQTRCWGR
jgi:type IV pilus assembly protein PilE